MAQVSDSYKPEGETSSTLSALKISKFDAEETAQFEKSMEYLNAEG
jgi:hypothetical protein